MLLTGGKSPSIRIWRRFTRLRLVDWAERMQELPFLHKFKVDIGLSGTIQCPKQICERIREDYLFGKPFRDYSENYRHKYLVVVDGNTWPNRFTAFLRSRSLVLYHSIFTEWSTALFKPNRHYLPFKLDLTDLAEQLDWAVEHDAQAKRIAERARKLAIRLFTTQQMNCYTSLLFLEYAELVALDK